MSLVFDSNVFIYHLNGVLSDYGQSLLKRGVNDSNNAIRALLYLRALTAITV